MKFAKTLLGGVLAVAGLAVMFDQDAQARSRTETCQSRYDRYQYCPADTRGGVRLYRQFSNTACIRDQTWGYDRGGIWVDRGCRAEFVIGRDRDDDYDGSGYYGGRRFVCDARGDGYRYCRADTRGGVRLVQQLSKTRCRQNDTWGYDRGGVWVDRGCRAEFETRR
jgi:hypothetical protein